MIKINKYINYILAVLTINITLIIGMLVSKDVSNITFIKTYVYINAFGIVIYYLSKKIQENIIKESIVFTILATFLIESSVVYFSYLKNEIMISILPLSIITNLSIIITLCFIIIYKYTKYRLYLIIARCITFTITMWGGTLLLYYIDKKKYINFDTLFAVMQTNRIECIEYLEANKTIIIIYIIILLLIYLMINKIIKREMTTISLRKREKISLILILIASLLFAYHKSKVLILATEIKKVNNYFAEIQKIKNKNLNNITIKSSGLKKGRINVVIIGESASRDHMGCYGYYRNTTPWMTSMLTNKNIILLKNAYASNKFTEYALSYALTSRSQYNGKNISESYSIIDVLRKINANTVWISNQPMLDNLRGSFNIIASGSNLLFYSSKNKNNYDSEILKYIDNIKIDSEKPNILFIHLHGSHASYYERFPFEQFNVFQKSNYKANDIDTYDNSIYYSDYIISNIFTRIYQSNKLDTFVYFSDHGELPGVGRDKFDWKMERIPAFIYCSDKYLQTPANLDKFAILLNNQNTYFSNDMIYDTLLGIWRIDIDEYDKKQDLSSESYDFNKNNLLSESGTKHVFEDPNINK